MAVIDLLARLKADTSQFIAGMEKAARATDNLNKSADKSRIGVDNLGKVFKRVAATSLALYAVKLGRDSVQAATIAGQAQYRLRKLLLNTNGASEEQIQILNGQGKALESLTGISKENITVIQSQLATFDLHGSTIGRLTPAILDYVVAEKGAAASADEFRTLTNGLAQALQGNFGSLTKTGFIIDANTKKMISSGNETQRSEAIVKVLSSTYRGFAENALTPAQKAQREFTRSVNETKEALGRALQPVIGAVATTISSTFTPILTQLQAKLADGKAIERFITLIKGLAVDITDFAKTMGAVFVPIFTSAIKIAIGALIGFIKVLGSIGRFIKDNSTFFTIAATAIISFVLATKAAKIAGMQLGKVLFNIKKAQQAYAFFTYASTGATTKFAFAMKTLGNAFRANPIGIIITALSVVAMGFKLAWEKSTTFRKVVVGAIQMVVKVVAKAFEILGKLPGGLGDFFDEAAVKAQDFAKGLEKYKTITKKTVDSINKDVSNKINPDGLGTTDRNIINDKVRKAAEVAAKKLAEAKQNLKEATASYNDFIKYEFSDKFTESAESARGAILDSLDKVAAVFEAKGKMLTGSALAKLRKSFDKLNDVIRGFIPQAEANAVALEAVTKKLEDAQSAYQDALKSRAEGASQLADILRRPFGEPSELTRALSSAEADVGSIISMYDKLAESINERYAGIDPAASQRMIKFLELQTKQLIVLAKRREVAVKVLEQAQKNLEDVLSEQADFNKTIAGNLRSYATALVDLSKADSAAVYNVARTATGFVISQIKASSSGIESITKQLQDRLKMITSFSANIKKLLSAGLNQDYVRQLLEAGPETASLTAQTLTEASAEQIASINSLYSQINSASTTFGTEMATVFYGNAVSMAQAFVTGAQAEVDSINAQMTFIKDSIATILAPLRDEGYSLGTDLALNMVNALENQRASLVATAQSIAEQIVAVIAAAFAQIGGFTRTTGAGGGGGVSNKTATPNPGKVNSSTFTYGSGNPMFGALSSRKGSNFTYGSGNPNVTVNIQTQKVTPTVTPNTVSSAVSKYYNYRRGR